MTELVIGTAQLGLNYGKTNITGKPTHELSKEIINYAERLSNGAKMPRINWNDLAAFRIVASTEDISEKFSVVISPLIEQIVCNVHSSKTLSSLRDTLLPRLISGQLRLPEVDSLLEESVL